MQKGMLTEKEKDVLRILLVERGITSYGIFDVINEGKSLPGSTYPCEIESMSGTIITPSEVYDFWLDWIDGHYTLGEEDGLWKIRNADTLYDKDEIVQIQKELGNEQV